MVRLRESEIHPRPLGVAAPVLPSAAVIVAVVVPAADERYAHNTLVLDMRELHNAFETLVITSGRNESHAQAIALEVEDHVWDRFGLHPDHIEGWWQGEWIALDYGVVIVHVFSDTARAYYDLEYLWKDAPVTGSPYWTPEPSSIS